MIGAGLDPHQALRVMWLRLTPSASPRERTYRPSLWVARRSAAGLYGFGDLIADIPEFVSSKRHQLRAPVSVTVRSAGVTRSEWTTHDGFAVTSIVRTFRDLIAANTDGGHVGRFAADAIRSGAITRDELRNAAGATDVDALIEMAAK